MENTDFNLISTNVINFIGYLDHLPDLGKVILQHLAVLRSLGIPVHSTQLKKISDHNYYRRCQDELLLAKNTKFEYCWITVYNLLVDCKRKLKNYAGNNDLIKDLKKKDLESKFPIYGATMNDRMQKGIKRRGLFDKSCTILSFYLPIFNPTHLIIRDVRDCVIEKKDLIRFCE